MSAPAEISILGVRTRETCQRAKQHNACASSASVKLHRRGHALRIPLSTSQVSSCALGMSPALQHAPLSWRKFSRRTFIELTSMAYQVLEPHGICNKIANSLCVGGSSLQQADSRLYEDKSCRDVILGPPGEMTVACPAGCQEAACACAACMRVWRAALCQW